MAETKHNWGVRPIATLSSEFWESDVDWHDNPNEETFQGGLQNVLNIQVEFRYKKPYGGSARYVLEIDKLTDHGSQIIIRDEIAYFIDPRDDNWHTEYKEYSLYSTASIIAVARNIEQILKFRITVQIQGPGHYDSGSGSGSPGTWSDPEARIFTAKFTAPELRHVREHMDIMERSFNDSMDYYRRHFR